MHDVVIIGGGAAGMTAAIYAARKVLDLVMISPDIGGQAIWASEVENYLGYRLISGFDLATKFEDHVRDFGVERVDDRVSSIARKGDTWLVSTESGVEYESRAVIVASGRSARNLGVPGEEKFKGRGISYCATCDAPLFRDERIAVVGGGNSGLDAAVQAAKFAREVTILEEQPHLTGDKWLQERARRLGNVQVLTSKEVTRVSGDAMVEAISVRDTSSSDEMTIPVAGVFIEIGSTPNLGFLPREVDLNEQGEIIVDCSNRTNMPGLFAAGDATSVPGKQIIVAAGEGAKALLASYDYIIHSFTDGG